MAICTQTDTHRQFKVAISPNVQFFGLQDEARVLGRNNADTWKTCKLCIGTRPRNQTCKPFSWEAKSLGRKQTHSFLWRITEVAANYASIKMPGRSYYDYWRLTVRRWDGEIEVFIKLFIILDNDPSICLILSRSGNLAVPNLKHWRKKLNKKFPRGS